MNPIQADNDYRQWCQKLLRLTWWFVVLLAVARGLLALWQLAHGAWPRVLWGLWCTALLPSLVYAAVYAVVFLLSLWLLRHQRYTTQAVLYLLGTTAMVALAAVFHRTVPLLPAAFAFPMFCVIFLRGRHALAWALGLAVAATLAHYWLWLPLAGVATPAETVISAVALMCMAGLLAGLIRRRQAQLLLAMHQASLQAKTDSLTGLYNHASFYDALDVRIQQYNKTGAAFCAVVFDIDNFKRVNDSFGHAVGDVVITTLVAVLRGQLQTGDEAFRYGGEEFSLLTSAAPQVAMARAQAVLDEFAATLSGDSWEFPITASAGVAAYDGQHFGGRREFFAAADEALYQAKRTGKNKVVLWTEEFSRRWAVFDRPAPEDALPDANTPPAQSAPPPADVYPPAAPGAAGQPGEETQA